MKNNLNGTKLFALTVLTILTTAFNFAIVIHDVPPAAFAYFLGTLNGAGWIVLLVLYLRRWHID